jgi:hypothetical protein
MYLMFPLLSSSVHLHGSHVMNPSPLETRTNNVAPCPHRGPVGDGGAAETSAATHRVLRLPGVSQFASNSQGSEGAGPLVISAPNRAPYSSAPLTRDTPPGGDPLLAIWISLRGRELQVELDTGEDEPPVWWWEGQRLIDD